MYFITQHILISYLMTTKIRSDSIQRLVIAPESIVIISFKEPHLVNYLKIAENIFLKEFSIHFFQYFYAARKLFYVLSRVLVIFATAVLSKHL